MQELKCWLTTVNTISRNLRMVKFEPEVHLLDKYISAGNTCLHIGAGIGRHTLIMSRLAGPAGAVYCFEPSVYSYKVLNRAVKFHCLANVRCYKKALADKPGRETFVTPLKKNRRLGLAFAHLGAGPSAAEEGLREDVEIDTVDNFCSREKIARVDFIRCDVEGAEYRVFRGAEQIIDRCHPTVLAEIHPVALKNFKSSAEQVYRFFQARGYRMCYLKDGKLVAAEAVIEEPWRDYFFIHQP